MLKGVAVRVGELVVALPAPNRHKDCILIIKSLGLFNETESEWTKSQNQGFYDENGKYYNRPDAATHAFKSGQISTRLGAICSEDLW